MTHQLIVTILGADGHGILSNIADAVSSCHCNILDSRQAKYGKDFSLTMIVEGSQTNITRLELKIPVVCQSHDLLSLMKRTKAHCKQNLEHVVDVEFYGEDTVGVLQQITALCAQFDIAISALRQKTFMLDGVEQMKCKMVVSVPEDVKLPFFKDQFNALLDNLSLTGHILENH